MADTLKVESPKAKQARKPGQTPKQRYEARKKTGLCVDCGKRKAKADRVQCQTCIDATAARAAKRAKKNK